MSQIDLTEVLQELDVEKAICLKEEDRAMILANVK